MTNPAFLPCPSDPCLGPLGDLDCCPICLEGYFQQHEVVVTACNHRYHEYCITEWLKTRGIGERTCAMCRSIAVPLVRESPSLFDDDKETNPFVESPILRSVRLGQRDVIAQLLLSNPSMANRRFLNGVSGNEVSLLYTAARQGHLELAADLLAAGTLVNASCKDGATSLHIAAQKGHRELATDLLAAGARVNATCKNGLTPLYLAAQNGHWELVVELLTAGAEPEKKWRIFGPWIKKSAIQAARQNHHDDIAQMLTDWIRDRTGR